MKCDDRTKWEKIGSNYIQVYHIYNELEACLLFSIFGIDMCNVGWCDIVQRERLEDCSVYDCQQEPATAPRKVICHCRMNRMAI